MKISAHFSLWGGLVFASLSFAYALYGLISIPPDMSAADLAEAHGFAMFWFFLGLVGTTMAVVSWLMLRGRFGPLDD